MKHLLLLTVFAIGCNAASTIRPDDDALPLPTATPTAAPTAAPASGEGSGTRLKARYYAGVDGSRLTLPLLWDSQLKFDCVPVKLPDTVRCLEAPVGALHYFADLTCTERVVTTPGTSIDVDTGAIYQAAGPYAGPGYTLTNGKCSTTSTPLVGWRVSAPQPADRFAEMVDTRDP